MIQIPFILRINLFDTKGAKTFSLFNNIKNNKNLFTIQ